MIDHLAAATAVAHLAGASVHASVNILDAGSVIKSFGLAGIFVILFVQTGLLIGFFLPGDTLLALAGAFAALPVSDSRHLPLAALLVGCPIAAIVGWAVRLPDRPPQRHLGQARIDLRALADQDRAALRAVR